MPTEYIWFKKGRESKRTADPEGKHPTLVKISPSSEIRYSYFDGEDGVRKHTESHVTNDLEHRDGDNPSYMRYAFDGKVLTRGYRKHGKLHRAGDKPALETYYTDGAPKVVEYRENGGRHRVGDKPAYKAYGNDGQTYAEGYYVYDELHRDDDKPAWVVYHRFRSGTPHEVSYYKHGDLHREGGKPAFIQYDLDGNVVKRRYYEHGEEKIGEDDIDLLKELGVDY